MKNFKNNCRICKSKIDLIDTLENCINEHPQIRNNSFKSSLVDINIYQCEKCTHIQIENFQSNFVYEDYNMDQFNPNSLDLNFVNLNNRRLEFLKKINNKNDNFLDIGCGAGDKLLLAEIFFKNCIGVEPSKFLYKEACNKNLNVLNEYFNDSLGFVDYFDAFISTQVFEHLDDPIKLLESAYKSLRYGGIGLINVPNGLNILSSGEYYQILPEHLNYFTPRSLAELSERVGFELIAIEHIHFADELDLYSRKPKKNEKLHFKRDVVKNELNVLISNYKRITIWGAGMKSHHYIYLIEDLSKIIHIVDNSVSKLGKYINLLEIPIEKPSQNILLESDAVIIFSSAYNNEVIHTLKTDYNFNGKIIFFDTSGSPKCI